MDSISIEEARELIGRLRNRGTGNIHQWRHLSAADSRDIRAAADTLEAALDVVEAAAAVVSLAENGSYDSEEVDKQGEAAVDCLEATLAKFAPTRNKGDEDVGRD